MREHPSATEFRGDVFSVLYPPPPENCAILAWYRAFMALHSAIISEIGFSRTHSVFSPSSSLSFVGGVYYVFLG